MPPGADVVADGERLGSGSEPPQPLQPLSPDEEAAWRAIARAIVTVPRALEQDLLREQDMSMSTYFVLMVLSESPDRRQPMSALARAAALSPSRTSRLVDELCAREWVTRERSTSDLRSSFAVLTDAGLERLVAAYPTHLASVRRHVVDHLSGLDLAPLAAAISQFATDPTVAT